MIFFYVIFYSVYILILRVVYFFTIFVFEGSGARRATRRRNLKWADRRANRFERGKKITSGGVCVEFVGSTNDELQNGLKIKSIFLKINPLLTQIWVKGFAGKLNHYFVRSCFRFWSTRDLVEPDLSKILFNNAVEIYSFVTFIITTIKKKSFKDISE